MNPELRATVVARDPYCLACGRINGMDVAAHHRKLRKHGGADSLINLVAIHHDCHHTVHMNPAASYKRGLLVKSWQDPQDIPITKPNGGRVYLTKDGGYESTEGASPWDL